MSYFLPIRVRKITSKYSGDLYIDMENGQKVLNTASVNYSYNSLHRVFKKAFQSTHLQKIKPQHVLVLGLGGGSILQLLRKDFGIQAPIVAVEIDPEIIQLAINEFQVHQYNPVEIIESDALTYISSTKEKYDIICVDVFIHDNVPAQFLTIPFIEDLISITNKHGLVYFNMMISNPNSLKGFNTIYEFLTSQKQISITDVFYLEVEENNRVLVIEK